MALAFVQILNNVDVVIEGSKRTREDMGGIWTSTAAKGTFGIGVVGNVAIDEEGRQAHDDFLNLLMEVKQHSHYDELKNRSKDAWMTYVSQNPSKDRRKISVTQSTVGPTFNLVGSLQVPVDTTGLQRARLLHLLTL